MLFMLAAYSYILEADMPFGSCLGTLVRYGVAEADGTAPPSAALNQAGFLIRTETASRLLPYDTIVGSVKLTKMLIFRVPQSVISSV